MKKIIAFIALAIIIFSTSGCIKRDDLEDITIYTTVYPIEFLTEKLYGYNSEVLSIYPDGVNTYDYALTDKQMRDYSRSAIFIYNGLTEEKEIARTFINNNRNLKIIDVSYGLKYTYAPEELWLSPNNLLMLATTIKTNLKDFMTSKYIKDEIEENYVTELEDTLSLMDAELRSVASANTTSKNVPIIASHEVFKFLENYGFNVIDLSDEENITTNNLNAIKNSFKNKTYSYIFVRDDEEVSELIQSLASTYGAEIITFKMLNNLTDDERKNNETYFTLMNQNIEHIKNATIGK